MSYSERELNTEWISGTRFADGANVNLETVRSAIQEQADENGIPVAFREDELKIGGLFSSQRDPILIMYNPEHETDYLRFAIRVTHQGRYAFLRVFNLGGSVNYGHDNQAQSGGVFGTLRKIGNAIGGHDQKIQAEEEYYSALKDCIEKAAGV